MYQTDNGGNPGYGNLMTGCGDNDFISDDLMNESDKVNRIVEGGYYGHPNKIRALTDGDSRQCVWKSGTAPSDNDYDAPLLLVDSSTDGIIEFVTDHFDGQLRGNLIVSKYQGSLYRIILTPNGEAVIPQSVPALDLVGAGTFHLKSCFVLVSSLHYASLIVCFCCFQMGST